MPFCKFCGAQLNDSDMFCPSCGNKNEAGPSASAGATGSAVGAGSVSGSSLGYSASTPSFTQSTASQSPAAPQQPAQPGYRVYGQSAATRAQAPAGGGYAQGAGTGAQSPAGGGYGQQPQQPYQAPAQPVYGGGASAPVGGKKNTALIVIIGVLVVALIAVAVLLITGNRDNGSVPGAPDHPTVSDDSSVSVPDDMPAASNSEAEKALQQFFDDSAANDPNAMLSHFWELSEYTSSDLASFVEDDMEEYGYANEAEQCGDWLDNLLNNYCDYFTYNNIWVYDGIESAEVTYFAIDDENPQDDVFVPAYAVVDITPVDETSPTTVEIPFSMAKYNGEWYIVFQDPQRAANTKAQNCVTGYLSTAIRGNLYNHLTYAYTYGTGDDYESKIDAGIENFYAQYGITSSDEEILATTSLLQTAINDFATSDVSGINVVSDTLYSTDIVIEDVSLSEDLSTYPADAIINFTCYVTVTVTVDFETESYTIDLEVPMCRDIDGYYFVETSY